MKPFNLEEAKTGVTVCTRDGHSVKILCFNVKGSRCPIVALIDFPESGRENLARYYPNGRFSESHESEYDLFMSNEEHEKHYDVSNFKPFDKVLVRDNNDEKWHTAIFSHYEIDENMPFQVPFVTGCHAYFQCIPYNDETAYLVGTTGMPSEKYVNW